jgi:hypothetical protein
MRPHAIKPAAPIIIYSALGAELGGSDSRTGQSRKFRCGRIDFGDDYLLNDSRDARTAHDSQFGLEITAKTKLTTITASTCERLNQAAADKM